MWWACPHYNESFGLVALEAQACGRPVVATDVGGLRHTVQDQQTGLLVAGHDPEPLGRRARIGASITRTNWSGWAPTRPPTLRRSAGTTPLRRRCGRTHWPTVDHEVAGAARCSWRRRRRSRVNSLARLSQRTAPKLAGVRVVPALLAVVAFALAGCTQQQGLYRDRRDVWGLDLRRPVDRAGALLGPAEDLLDRPVPDPRRHAAGQHRTDPGLRRARATTRTVPVRPAWCRLRTRSASPRWPISRPARSRSARRSRGPAERHCAPRSTSRPTRRIRTDRQCPGQGNQANVTLVRQRLPLTASSATPA